MDKKRTGESLKDMFLKEVEDKAPERQGTKESKHQNSKTLKRQNAKELKSNKRKHTIYLSPEQSKKLRVYAAEKDLTFSEVIEKLINETL
ncbi:hypothetical protein IBX65_08305 [Candidatus Aerophobetes bacterium]|nr:hypothetical protein [Candidatus Aerophobetes bacterium]